MGVTIGAFSSLYPAGSLLPFPVTATVTALEDQQGKGKK
jgi:hypothetical protein